MRSKNMTELMAQVERAWPFDEQSYKGIPADIQGRKSFALSHCLIHVGVTTGKCLEALEPTQHGDELSSGGQATLRRESILLVFQALRMLALLKINFQDFVDYMEDKESRELLKRKT